MRRLTVCMLGLVALVGIVSLVACSDEDESKWVQDPTPNNLCVEFSQDVTYMHTDLHLYLKNEELYIRSCPIHMQSRTSAAMLLPGEYFFKIGAQRECRVNFEVVKGKETYVFVKNDEDYEVEYRELPKY